MKEPRTLRRLLWALLLCALPWAARPAQATQPGQVLDTPVTSALIDRDHCAVFEGGKEQKERVPAPEQILWAKDYHIRSPYGEAYGASKALGPRHLRYAFKEAIPVGSVFFTGGHNRVSVLKEDAAYPGDMSKESDWIPAEALRRDGKTTTEEQEGYVVWVLPPNTRTRAIRFSHAPQPLDKDKHGWVSCALLLRERFQSIAPFARVYSETNQNDAQKIINQRHDGLGGTWSNITNQRPIEECPVVDKAHPGVFSLVWPEDVVIDTLLTLHTGFRSCEVDVYAGPADRDPATAKEEDWKFVKAFTDLELNFPTTWPNALKLDKPVKTRGLRMRLIEKVECSHGHTQGQNRDGKRVYLDDLMVLRALDAKDKHAAPAFVAKLNKKLNPPIPVKFRIPEAGNVTLVIEKPDGTRVRNLISDVPFPAGENVAWWDASTDLQRDIDAANHGLLRIPDDPVTPGDYVVRGLWHKPIRPVYEFGVYAPGRWVAGDNGSDWLGNHSNPQAAAFVPAKLSPLGEPLVYLGCQVTEGVHGFIWVDMKGDKRGGMTWVGGNWLAAPYIGADCGPDPDPGTACVVAAVFEKDGDGSVSEVRLNAIEKGNPHGVRQINRLAISKDFKGDKASQLNGIAIYNRSIALALNKQDAVWVVSVKDGGIQDKYEKLPNPRGVAYNPVDGKLFVISGNKIVSVEPGKDGAAPAYKDFVASGLQDPVAITFDAKGSLYVSDRGKSHQVKVFGKDGKFVRAIGKAGTPKPGPYDEKRMNNPHGIAVDNAGRLWVAENDSAPKRVSLWGADGKFARAWYGPGKYGEGGTIDPSDPTKFYYGEGNGCLEFKVDWKTGTSRLVNVLFRQDQCPVPSAGGYGGWFNAPEYALYHAGQRYLTNCWNNNPISAPAAMTIYRDLGNGTIQPSVTIGMACQWKEVLDKEEFHKCWPDPNKRENGLLIWCDRNDDGKPQPDEVFIGKDPGYGPSVMSDMSVCISNYAGKSIRLLPQWAVGSKVPSYDLQHMAVLATDVFGSPSDGGDYALADDSDEVVLAKGLKPFSPYSLSGTKKGKAAWSYPTLWPGLHASHSAPQPNEPGQLIGTTRVLGPLMKPKGSQVAPVWMMTGNCGSSYMFTRDGLFVTSVFGDERQSRPFGIPEDKRGTVMENMTYHGENFWVSTTCTKDGKVYLVSRCRILRIDGLDTLRPIAKFPLKITQKDLDKVREYRAEVERLRRLRQGSGMIKAQILPAGAIKVDGKFDEWKNAVRVEIEKQGTGAWFDSNSRPYDVKGSMAVCGDRFCAMWETGNRDLLRNTGEMPLAPFKTGGCLDVMLCVKPDLKHGRPMDGDLRLLVTRVGDKTKALIYRQVSAQGGKKVPFSSPSRTINFDEVTDVSDQVELASDNDGRFEVSIPLAALRLKPAPGMRLKADIGVLRGEGGKTNARVYWSNKNTAIVADVPSEAELQPGMWGLLEFVK
ncbi:MAG: hypothetical protein J6333_12075 [Planctomycetes bacterium]|nr:hypothetical protein [Planctomycetota bacterium]